MRASLVCAALALLVAAGVVRAERAVRVYEVVVAPTEENAAIDAGIRTVLVRATGRASAGDDAALASIVAEPRRYLVSARAAPSGGGTLVTFDSTALDGAILAAGRPLWPRERPLVLVVFDPSPVGANSASTRRAIEDTATLRGLPVSIVPYASLNLDVGGEPPREMLLPAVKRLGADAILIGRGSEGGSDAQWQWSLAAPGVAESWSGSAVAGINGATDALVRVSDAPEATTDTEALVSITGIADLKAYAGVTQALAQLPGVKRVAIEEANGDTAIFRVTARGTSGSLASSIEAAAAFEPGPGATPGTLSFYYQP
jgi:hypothetical protein